MNRDYAIIDGKPNCGSGGVFVEQRDDSGAFICKGAALSLKYARQSNHVVLQLAFPSYYRNNQELWAEEDVIVDDEQRKTIVAGENPDTPFLIYYYRCSRAMNEYLVNKGRLPMSYEYPPEQGCPVAHKP